MLFNTNFLYFGYSLPIAPHFSFCYSESEVIADKFTRTLTDYFAGSHRIRILLGSLFAAIVADGIITKFLVSNGFATEGNPFLGDWVTNDKFFTLKIFGALLALCYLWSIYRRHPKLSISFSAILLAVYTFIVLRNVLILL